MPKLEHKKTEATEFIFDACRYSLCFLQFEVLREKVSIFELSRRVLLHALFEFE